MDDSLRGSRRDRLNLWNRCFWLYLAVAIIFYAVIDRQQAYLNRMNFLKDIEYDLELFLKDKINNLSEDTLRWAVRYYKQLQKYAPGNSLYFGDLGFCYFYLGQFDKAMVAYQKAIELEPQLYTYYFDLGMIYFRLGRMDEAVDSLFASLEHFKGSVRYFIKTAEVLQTNVVQDFSAVSLALIKRAEEDEEKIILTLFDIYASYQNYEKAAAIAEQGLQTQARNPKLYYKAGWAYYMLGDYDRAVDYLTTAVELDPNFVNAYYFRGVSLGKKGEIEAGKRDIARVKVLTDQGIQATEDRPDHIKLHLNRELRILRQQFG